MCTVLESLEREYGRCEDWCESEKATASADRGVFMTQLLQRHHEQKEGFLKVRASTCTCTCTSSIWGRSSNYVTFKGIGIIGTIHEMLLTLASY